MIENECAGVYRQKQEKAGIRGPRFCCVTRCVYGGEFSAKSVVLCWKFKRNDKPLQSRKKTILSKTRYDV